MIFCTLFDSNYLDKGLVMIRSLMRVREDFRIYVLAMDKRCEEVLESYHYPSVVIIPVERFSAETGLNEIRNNRSRAEFCWTCTSFLIHYVLTHFQESVCTYVDADLRFYSDPQVLTDEMGDKTVQIVEHRFHHTREGKWRRAESGTYCVQFNTFKNTPDALELLEWWKGKCYESCSNSGGGLKREGVMGDQGYLEKWGNKENVSVLQNPGGGVAPWNMSRYMATAKQNILRERKTGKEFQLVFYHYHNIQYLDRYHMYLSIYEIQKADPQLINQLYSPYLTELDNVKEELKNRFDFFPLIQNHPGLARGEQRYHEKSKIQKAMQLIRDKGFYLTFQDYLFRYIYKKKQQYNFIALEGAD